MYKLKKQICANHLIIAADQAHAPIVVILQIAEPSMFFSTQLKLLSISLNKCLDVLLWGSME